MQEDIKEALSVFRDCYMPIEECKRLCYKQRLDLKQEVEVWESDIYMHNCIALSIQARNIGEFVQL